MFRSKTAASLATKIAHTSTLPALGNKDLRLLQDVIINEKGILTAMQKLAVEFAKASESLKIWGLGEGEDLGDIMNHSASIFGYFSAALNNYANHEHSVRVHLKTIRTREEKLEELKRKRKNVASKADTADKKLSKMSGENKNLPAQTALLNQLRDEIRQLDTEITIEETKLSDFKRLCSHNFMALKFGGLLELGEKATIIGELGKLLIEEIPLDPTPPGQPRAFYQSHTKTTAVVDEVSRCMAKVVFNPGPDVNISADAYGPPTSMETDNSRLSDEPMSPNNNYDTSQYPVANYADNSLPSINAGLPANEFGESLSSQRRFASQSGAISPTSPDVLNGRTGGGGQFNTFPVKSRAPALETSEIGALDSFSANVATALQYAEGGETSIASTGLQKQDSSNEDEGYNRNTVVYTDEDSQLPYTQYKQQDNGRSANTSGVRFRTPSMEVSGKAPVAPGIDSPTYPAYPEQEQQQPSAWTGGTLRRSRRKLSDAGQTSTDNLDVPEEVGEEDGEKEEGGNPAYDHEVFGHDRNEHDEDDERERNAAAAREIAREMDTLGFPMPPIYTLLPQQQHDVPPPSLPGPITIPTHHSPHLAQPLGSQQSGQEQQQAPQAHVTSPQRQQLSASRTPSPLSPLVQAPSSASPITVPSGHSYSSYRAESPQIPPISPISRTNDHSPIYNAPTSSALSSTAASASNILIPSAAGVGGPRTISAAAFKRGARDGEANRKRFLPTSPRPSIDSGSVATPPYVPVAEGAWAPAHQSALPSALTPGGQPRTSSSSNREPSSPTSGLDYGMLGNIRIANATQPQHE